MSKKTITLRRQKLHALAVQDALNRCRQCRLPLALADLAMGRPFCCVEHEEDYADSLLRYTEAKARLVR